MLNELIENVKEINSENDIFGTYQKAISITEFIELDENEKILSENNLIAIYGEWGTGKSCLMKTIASKLNKQKYDISWFDTWKYEHDDNLAYSLFKFIGQDRFLEEQKIKSILSSVYGIFKSLTNGIELNYGPLNFKPGEVINKAVEAGQEMSKNVKDKKCLWEKINEFEHAFASITFDNDKKLIVFLDDLDRCESENIITLISAIKLLLSINKNIIFIIGLDKKAVTLALRNKYNNDFNKADEYLEKIFPINFEITNNLQNNNLLDYISNATGLNTIDSKIILNLFKELNFSNARHIKKVLRKYYLSKNYLSTKIDINNKYFVSIIIYTLILNIFYNDEYKALLLEDKEKIYENIILTQRGRDGVTYEYSFSKYKLQSNWSRENSDSLNIYDFFIRFSSYKYQRNYLHLAYVSTPSMAVIEVNDWLALFDNSICRDFIEFSLVNEDIFSCLLQNNLVNDAIIYDILKEVDNIV